RTPRPCRSGARRYLAERVGFEPTLRLPVNRISSAAHSTSLPPLRGGVFGATEAPGRSGGRRLGEAPLLAKPVLRRPPSELGIAHGGTLPLAPRIPISRSME